MAKCECVELTYSCRNEGLTRDEVIVEVVQKINRKATRTGGKGLQLLPQGGREGIVGGLLTVDLFKHSGILIIFEW